MVIRGDASARDDEIPTYFVSMAEWRCLLFARTMLKGKCHGEPSVLGVAIQVFVLSQSSEMILHLVDRHGNLRCLAS